MQGENDNIDINHDMLSKLKALHVMLQDHIPKNRHWEHAWCKHNQNTGFRSSMASYYGAFLMLFVLGTKQTTNGNCLNKYSMKSHQKLSSNNNMQNGTISGWINSDKISWFMVNCSFKSIAGQMANPISQCCSLFSFTNQSAWFLWFLSQW